MSKYKKCPYCRTKNPADVGICTNCNRLIEGPIIPITEPPKKKENGKGFTFSLIRLFIFIFILVFVVVYFSKEPKIVTTNTKDNYQEESFEEKMNSIFYDSSYQDNKLIPVKDYTDSKPFKLVNKNGEIIVDKIVNYVADYNTFHIITKRNKGNLYYYIVNNKGEKLYKAKNKIYYYPNTNSWIIGDKLYHNEKIVKDKIKIDNNLSYNGYYFPFVADDEQGIVDFEGNVGYTSKTKEYNHFVLETTNISNSEKNNYCLINDNYQYIIVDCRSGETIINNNREKIYEIGPNTYYKDNIITYINNSRELITYNTDSNKNEVHVENLDDNKILIDKFVYNENTREKEDINETDLHSLTNKEIESDLNIQKEYCLTLNQLRYGLKYNKTEVVPCTYTNIVYYDPSIVEDLKTNQKIYIILSNHKQHKLYDVKNNTILIDNVINYSPNSVFLEYKDENNSYIYNIISDEKIEVPKETYIELHSNYFMLEKYSKEKTTTNREYYNTEFKNIYLGK